MNPERPATSKARGICKYYLTPRGCFTGKNCKFLHGEQESLTPYDKNKTCRFYVAGFCKRGAGCWFVHALPEASGSGERSPPVKPEAEAGDDDVCCICYEKPVTYGLLGGCSHMFCLECIKGWRERKGKSEGVICSGVIKMCPLCRAASKFVTPSSVFYTQNDPRKTALVEQYKSSMARVPCRFFERSLPNNRYCPFGNDCFYQHCNEDGTPYDFQKGVEYYMRQRKRYLDANGAPLGRLQATTSLLQSLRHELDRIQTSLESIPGIDSIPDGALDDAEDILTEADLRLSDDRLLPVPPSIRTTLAESVMFSTAASEDLSSTAQEPLYQGDHPTSQDESLNSLAATVRTIVEEVNYLMDDTERLTSPSSQPSPTEELYELLPRSEDVRPIFDLTATTAEEEVVLDYGVEEPHPPLDHSIDQGPQPATIVEVPASGEDASASAPTPTPEQEPLVAGPLASMQDPLSEATPAAAPEVVYDSDPPFRTDGRGRVVWSSATVSTRGRKHTSIPSGMVAASLPPHRDVPRDIAPSADHVASRSLEGRVV
ncbi:uncharacterized protein PHACADRAFT_213748 [Phanerochaete carnosa HHB-10118-sp]|uniref:Uncharacterized protein n=1 Tax=Phanerochaete carnosa (strain HHB-10118-sp) TaxID=650164 RepID=K5WIB5_PHACS|nr:uncharacterized protein PHACADRAFT_213748 [Phanerochaete carnosa HHB-10118-sp]EKM49977.1 hypothetical protein PHACADRAFT_213748 [Phanerochaete carnosa HHB-10118-sp]